MHSDGNVLLQYGFTRHRQPPDTMPTGCSAYQIQPDKEQEIVLWGFGVFYGEAERGGLYLRRYGFLPKLLRTSKLSLPIWTSEQLPPRQTPRQPGEILRLLELLQQTLRFIARYEEWVVQQCGLAYRQQCLRVWERETIAAEEMLPRWRALQQHCEIILNKQREKIA